MASGVSSTAQSRRASITKVKAAVVGLGMGRGHLRALLGIDAVQVVAVCDKSPERISLVRQQHPELPDQVYFDDYSKMLKQTRPDAVIIALPNYLHHPATLEALKAGADVMCEKPMATNLQQAVEMAETARRFDRILMINFSYRFKPTTQAMREVVESGELGEIYFARTGWLRQKGIPRGTGWFYRKEMAGGGPLIDLGVHRIDLAWYLMGRPKVRSVTGVTFQKFGPTSVEGFDVEDLAAGFIRFADGRAMTVAVSWDSFCEQPEQMWTELYGTAGAAIERNVGGGYEWTVKFLKEVAGYRIGSEPARLPRQVPGPVEHFIDCVINRTQPLASAEDGVEVQKMLDGLYQSAETGREVIFD